MSQGSGSPSSRPRRRSQKAGSGRAAAGKTGVTKASAKGAAPATRTTAISQTGLGWEYRWQMGPLAPVPDAPNRLVDALNPLGADGWEVCGFAAVADGEAQAGWVLLKRPVP